MILPSVDYTPLRQAKSQESQAKRSQFIAPQIDYQTKGLQLQEKGLERTQSHISEQQNINTLQFMYETGKTLVSAAFTAGKAAQMAKAQSMGTEMAQAVKTYADELTANGEMYVTTSIDHDPTDAEGGVSSAYIVGMDKLEKFENQQLQQIQDQRWFPSVKEQTIQAMKGVYSGLQQRTLQNYWANETKARYQLEQKNLSDAINMDIAQSTLESPSYANTMATIANMNRGSNASSLLSKTSIQDINFGVAANAVRDAAITGGSPAGTTLANQISDSRGYNADERNKLLGYANSAAHQAKINAQNEGMQTMQTAIDSGMRNFTDLYKQNDESKRSPEAKMAYKAGLEAGQIDFLGRVKSDALKDIDFKGINQLREDMGNINSPDFSGMFDGTDATNGMLQSLRKEYSDRIKDYEKQEADYNKALGDELKKVEEAEKKKTGEDLLNTQRLAEGVYQDFKDKKISGIEASERLWAYSINIKSELEDGRPFEYKDLYNFNKAMDKMIHDTSYENLEKNIYKEEINSSLKRIDEGLQQFFHIGEVGKEQRSEYFNALRKAKGSLLDLAYDGKDLSQSDFDDRASDILALYHIDTYKALTLTPREGGRRDKYQDAMDITAGFENNPNAVYEKALFDDAGNSSREWVWIDDKQRNSFDNAAKLEQSMLEENYGIEIDKDKPIEYGSIRGQLNSYDTDAESKGLVPVFTAKDGKKYTVQGRKVYQYFKGRTGEEITR